MRCLLDKVTARRIMEGMLKLVEGREVTSTELFALYFYRRSPSNGIALFILPQTHNLLKRLEHLSRYVVLIRSFLAVHKLFTPPDTSNGGRDVCANMVLQKKMRKYLH